MATFDGKRVLITAGGGGLGRVIAECFAGQGARVLVTDIDERAVKEASDAGLMALCCDAADRTAVDGLFQQVERDLGGLDILVNNVGIAGPTGKLDEVEPDLWIKCIEVCLTSHFLAARKAVPMLRAAGGGSIVEISSTAGLYGYPLRTPYAAAKWAVIGLAKSLAAEVGVDGIRVNAICPGSLEGERMDRVIAAQAKASGHSEEEIRRDYTRQSSLRAFTSPQEVAETVLFLCSDAGKGVSGQAIAVDGHTETFT